MNGLAVWPIGNTQVQSPQLSNWWFI